MKNDSGSNFTIADGLDAVSRGADTYYTDPEIDHALSPTAQFHISCGTFATSLVATLQHSDDNGVADSYTDEVAGYGNTVSVTLTAAGEGNIYVPNPRERYSRVKLVLGGACVASVTNISGPLRSVDQG